MSVAVALPVFHGLPISGEAEPCSNVCVVPWTPDSGRKSYLDNEEYPNNVR
jgi:hypothetical protein